MKLEAINKNLIEVKAATKLERDQLEILLTKKIDNARFHPLVKRGVWDGKICKLSKSKYFSFGLWHYVKSCMKKHGYDVSMRGVSKHLDHEIDFEEFKQFCMDIMEKHPKITPYDYQVETAFKFLKFKKASAELATSAGKTLVTWLIFRWLMEKNDDFKALMIVPKIDLVTQADDDFYDYNQGQTEVRVQEIYSNAKEIRGEPDIVVGTYQSLSNKDKEFFEDFDLFMVDEAHQAKIKSMQNIVKKLQHTEYRYGMSGTFPEPGTLDYLTLCETTGPTVSRVTVDQLEDSGQVTPAKIKVLRMDYLDAERRNRLHKMYNAGGDARKKVFQLEKKICVNSSKRLKFITNVISKSTKNSLILFYRKKHGKAIYNRLKDITDGKEIYYIDGDIPDDNREVIKKKMERGDDKLLVASFQIFSTGISINNLHNIFFTESYKSKFIIRQSIGRGIRLHDDKDYVTIVDFSDDFRVKDGNRTVWTNYLYKHSNKRIKIYKNQKFDYDIKNVSF